MPTVRHEDAPEFLRDAGDAVRTGHRPQLTPRQCLASLWYAHSQSGNVWTFLVKIPLSAAACFAARAHVLARGDAEHARPFAVLLAACLAHAPVSAAYHLFMCVSPRAKAALSRADYALIFVMTLLTSHALGHFALRCAPELRARQLAATAAPAAANVALALSPLYARARQTRALRAGLSATVIALALSPVFYDAAYGPRAPRDAASWGLASCAAYVAGAAAWVARFPERRFPYAFDRHLNSHACMHVAIVAAHLSFYMFLLRGYENAAARGWSCAPA